MKRVALFTHPACLAHNPGMGHPECPDRLRGIMAALDHPNFVTLLREEAPLATQDQLRLVHPPAFVAAMLALEPEPGEILALDGDTFVGRGSITAARRAAGGVVAAVDAVMEGWADAAFAAVRPPGHHAEPSRAMGFCLFASVAIAAAHARARWGLARIAVVDFDVHHGNGTQDIFYNDANLFYASSHQSPCYPGSGASAEQGVAGNIVNLPLAPHSGSAEFRAAWENIGLPALRGFKPDLLLVSAGFDAHLADPLAQLRLQTADFGWITDQLVAAAEECCGGRIVSALEGGYDIAALSASAALHVRRLMQ